MITPRQFSIVLTGAVSISMLSSVVFGSLTDSEPALASQTQVTYVPPNRGAPVATQGSGSRGCSQSLPVSVNLLVPNDHIGLTTSSRPTFFWTISNSVSAPIEFALVEPGVAQPVYVKQIQSKQSEIVKLEMPSNTPELEVGKQYRWSVSVVCDSGRRSNDIYAQGWIKRTALSFDLNSKIRQANSPLERSSIYAQSGIWYDALATITSDRSTLDNFGSLLNQAGLQVDTSKPVIQK